MDKESQVTLQIFRKLPLIDCGACGYTKCREFAKALVAGEAEVYDCPHLPEETTEEILLIVDEYLS